MTTSSTQADDEREARRSSKSEPSSSSDNVTVVGEALLILTFSVSAVTASTIDSKLSSGELSPLLQLLLLFLTCVGVENMAAEDDDEVASPTNSWSFFLADEGVAGGRWAPD